MEQQAIEQYRKGWNDAMCGRVRACANAAYLLGYNDGRYVTGCLGC